MFTQAINRNLICHCHSVTFLTLDSWMQTYMHLNVITDPLRETSPQLSYTQNTFSSSLDMNKIMVLFNPSVPYGSYSICERNKEQLTVVLRYFAEQKK